MPKLYKTSKYFWLSPKPYKMTKPFWLLPKSYKMSKPFCLLPNQYKMSKPFWLSPKPYKISKPFWVSPKPYKMSKPVCPNIIFKKLVKPSKQKIETINNNQNKRFKCPNSIKEILLSRENQSLNVHRQCHIK